MTTARRRPDRARQGTTSLSVLSPVELLDFAAAFAGLGNAVGSQLIDAAEAHANGLPRYEVSARMSLGALRWCQDKLRGKSAAIDELLDAVQQGQVEGDRACEGCGNDANGNTLCADCQEDS